MSETFSNHREFIDALMEIETLLNASPGSQDAQRRDELTEAILRHEAIIEPEPEWLLEP